MSHLVVAGLVILVDIAAAGAFAVIAALYAKRIGGSGPWLLAAFGAIDVMMLVVFGVVLETTWWHAYASHDAVNRAFMGLDLVDIVMTTVAAGFALVGFIRMMPKT